MKNKTFEEKEKYLYEKVYENIKTTHTDKLTISTYYAKKVAEMLGGDYNDLTKIQKQIFISYIVNERINLNKSITDYIN